MTSNTTWHSDPELLAGYMAGALGRAQATSVEAHLVTCASCRAAVVPLAAPERLVGNLAAITERVDEPRLHPIERLLQRIGVPERITRVLMVTPSARTAWLTAVAVALAVAVVAGGLRGSGERTVFAFLVVAPLLPLAGVTVAFGTRTDPLRELIVTAPTPAFELLLVRALAVLAPTIALAALASALVPGHGWDTVLWLLPSFGLTATTVALGSWLPMRPVAWVLGGAWVVAAAISVRGAPSAELVEGFAAFRPAGQVVLVAVTLLAGIVVAVRRDSFDFVDVGRTA